MSHRPQRRRHRLGLPEVGIGVVRIPEDTGPGRLRRDLTKHLEPLRGEVREEKGQSGHVPSRPGEAHHETRLDGIIAHHHDDRHGAGGVLGERGHVAAQRIDEIGLELNELDGVLREALDPAFGVPVLEREVAALRPAESAERLAEGRQIGVRRRRAEEEHADPGLPGRLRRGAEGHGEETARDGGHEPTARLHGGRAGAGPDGRSSWFAPSLPGSYNVCRCPTRCRPSSRSRVLDRIDDEEIVRLACDLIRIPSFTTEETPVRGVARRLPGRPGPRGDAAGDRARAQADHRAPAPARAAAAPSC